jgi:hypothetical protein
MSLTPDGLAYDGTSEEDPRPKGASVSGDQPAGSARGGPPRLGQ